MPNPACASVAVSRPEIVFSIMGTSLHGASTDPPDIGAAYVARPGWGNSFFRAESDRHSAAREARTRRGADQPLLHHRHHKLAVARVHLAAREPPGAAGHRRVLRV